LRILAADFIDYMIQNLIFPLEYQEHIGEGKDLWCLDWWIIEIAKYFFEGEVDYLRFPKARRLENNDNFNKEDIVEICRQKMIDLEELELTRSSKVLVFETCRGFDTKLVSNIKEWEKIYVVDENKSKAVIDKTKEYLQGFSNVELVDGNSFTNEGPIPWMKSNSFKGGFKI